jgi:hypothetical protein
MKAKTINKTTADIPNLYVKSKILGEIGDPLSLSIVKITICPPSKIGIGTRFITPRPILT